MAANFPKKSSWLRCLASFLPAAGVAALLCFLLDGPQLGHFYDFLLRRRPAIPVAPELLIIDTSVPGKELAEDILEPGAASSLLYTMTELGAGTLIIQVPILGLSAGGMAGEAEILYRFDEEFTLLSRNISNLFDGIKTGSVSPADSARYVGELVELSGKGKERLVSALVRRDEEGIAGLEKAAAFFGHVRRPGDLRVQLIRAGSFEGTAAAKPSELFPERDEYSRARPDRDGILRRIAPVLKVPELSEGTAGERTLEHIIFGTLKPRYKSAQIEYTASGPVLAARHGPDGIDTIIPLDKNGELLFQVLRKGEDFRRIGISEFLSYDESDRSLRRLLGESEALGIFHGIEGENRPDILYDYALSLREELVSLYGIKDQDKKHAWIELRNRYFSSLEEFLSGPVEMNSVRGYEEIIASESLGSGELAKMTEMRDSLIQRFALVREKYKEVLELRNKLEAALAGSFCILGRGSFRPAETPASVFRNFPGALIRNIRSALYGINPTDMEASALMANSILTGRAIKPGGTIYLFCGALICAFLACFVIRSSGLAATLGMGALITLLAGTFFSLSFILSGIWLDPIVPAASSAAGVLVSLAWVLISRRRYNQFFRQAFGPFVSHSCLKSVIRMGSPHPSQAITVRAAMVAIKCSDAVSRADAVNNYTQKIFAFHKKVYEIITRAGGTIVGTEGDIVITCFGSPLERVFLGGKRRISPYEDNIHALTAPAQRAVDVVLETARRPECSAWHFGLDIGNSTFAWTAISGYFAMGSAVQRARILSRLVSRYKVQIIVSSAVNEALPDLTAKKLDTTKGKDGTAEESFYSLAAGRQHGYIAPNDG